MRKNKIVLAGLLLASILGINITAEYNYSSSSTIDSGRIDCGNSIFGGYTNTIKNDKTNKTNYSSIFGGESNKIEGGEHNTIVGGYNNKINYTYYDDLGPIENANIFGGDANIIDDHDNDIFGGSKNHIYFGSEGSTILGGEYNSIVGTTTGGDQFNRSVIVGGYENKGSGFHSLVLGGNKNFTRGDYSVSVGGIGNIVLAKAGVAIGGGMVTNNATGGIAIGSGAVCNESGTISFGCDEGDTVATVSWENNDYTKTPTIKENKSSNSKFNRLTNVADGIKDHDVATVGQVKQLVSKSGGSAGATYTAGSDIVISDANEISVAKTGQITSNNTGLVTGDTVYQVTNKLNNTLTDQGVSITAANNKITSLSSTIETIRKNMVEMNTSVSTTIADLPSSLGNFINKDLSNLSTDGQNTLKALIKSEIKNQMSASKSASAVSTMDSTFVIQAAADTSYVDNAVAGKADKAELNQLAETVATKADKKDLDALATKVDTKADKTYVDSELSKKADQSTVDAISIKVDTNAKNILANTEAIKGNASAIADLKENKADVTGANIDVSTWSEKLGTGKVAKDDAGLVTGGTVFNALEEKADIGYVNAGFQAMGTQMQEMNQSLTRDINKVGAGAAALAGLHPQEYDPDSKLDFAVGYGHYRNANATALGMYYRPNVVTTLSLAGTIGNGDPMLSAGLSFKLGMGKHVEKVMVTKDDLSAMQNRLASQDKEIAEQKEAMTSQNEKIAELENMVKQLMAR